MFRNVCVALLLATTTFGAMAQDALEAAAQLALPNVMDVRVTVTPERARLVIDLAGRTDFSFVSVSDPDRLAIDVRAATFSVPQPSGTPAGEPGIVSDYVVEQAGPDRVRTTLTLSEPAQVQQAYVLDAFEDQPARLVVDIIPATAAEFSANVAKDLTASTAAAAPAVTSTSTPPAAQSSPLRPVLSSSSTRAMAVSIAGRKRLPG